MLATSTLRLPNTCPSPSRIVIAQDATSPFGSVPDTVITRLSRRSNIAVTPGKVLGCPPTINVWVRITGLGLIFTVTVFDAIPRVVTTTARVVPLVPGATVTSRAAGPEPESSGTCLPFSVTTFSDKAGENPVPLMRSWPPMATRPGVTEVMKGVTVKVSGDAVLPFTVIVTVCSPAIRSGGTVPFNSVKVDEVSVAAAVFEEFLSAKVTVLLATVGEKPVPVIVNSAPPGP